MVVSQLLSRVGLLKNRLINSPSPIMKPGQTKSVKPDLAKTIAQETPKLMKMLNNFREYGVSINDVQEMVHVAYGNR